MREESEKRELETSTRWEKTERACCNCSRNCNKTFRKTKDKNNKGEDDSMQEP